MRAGRVEKSKVEKQNLPPFLSSTPSPPLSLSFSVFLSLSVSRSANKMSAFILLLQSVGYMSADPSKALPLQAKGL